MDDITRARTEAAESTVLRRLRAKGLNVMNEKSEADCIFCHLNPPMPGRAACAACYIERMEKLKHELAIGPYKSQAQRLVSASRANPARQTEGSEEITVFEPVLIDCIASALSSRDAEVKQVLEGLRSSHRELCWCALSHLTETTQFEEAGTHDDACLRTRDLYSKLQAPNSESQQPETLDLP